MMTKDDVYTILKEEILGLLPVNESDISFDKKLADLGANSIDRAEIVINCMKKLEITIKPSDLAQVKNIGDLLDSLFKTVTSK